LPSFTAAACFISSITLALLQSRAAQAFDVKCASPTQPGKLQARSSQAAFAQDHGARLGTCTVRIDSTELEAKPGILITAIDQKQIRFFHYFTMD
jgi:hypothetical protein